MAIRSGRLGCGPGSRPIPASRPRGHSSTRPVSSLVSRPSPERSHTVLSHVSAATAFRAALIAVSVAGAANPSIAAKITECTKISICYCVNGSLKDVIDAKVARFREILASKRRAGKAVGYTACRSRPLAVASSMSTWRWRPRRGGTSRNASATGRSGFSIRACLKRTFQTVQAPTTCRCGSGPRRQGGPGRGFRFRLLRRTSGFCPLLSPRRQCGHAENRAVLR